MKKPASITLVGMAVAILCNLAPVSVPSAEKPNIVFILAKDPGESTLVHNPKIQRKLRGMAILFQEEMRLDARPAGDANEQDAK